MGCLKQISLHLSLSFHSSAPLFPLKLLEILQESVSLLRDLDPTGKAGAFHPACGVHRVAKEAVPRHPAANDARAHIASVDARPNLREREREDTSAKNKHRGGQRGGAYLARLPVGHRNLARFP